MMGGVERCCMLLLLLAAVAVSVAEDVSDCDILVGRLSGPDPQSHPVSETVFEWIEAVAGDSCGLIVELFDGVVTEDNFIAFNEAALERNASAMLIGTYGIEGDSVLMYLTLEQIYTNPDLFADRKFFSRPDEAMVFDSGLLGSSSPPDFVRFHGLLLAAFAHNRQGLNQTALTEIDHALENVSGVPPEALSEAYLARSQVVRMVTSNFSAGMADLDTALELNVNNIRARLAKGYLCELAGDAQTALDQYTLAIETNPTMYKPYKTRANLYSNLRMYEESIADYTMAVQLNPDDIESWHYGGVDYTRTGDYYACIEWYTRALELEPEASPNEPIFLTDRSIGYLMLEDIESALTDLTAAVELSEYRNDIPQMLNTSLILSPVQRLSETEQGSATYWFYLGLAYSNGGFYEEAIEPYTRAILMNRSMMVAYYERSRCWIELGITEQAVEDLQNALEITSDPSDRELIQGILDQLGQ